MGTHQCITVVNYAHLAEATSMSVAGAAAGVGTTASVSSSWVHTSRVGLLTARRQYSIH